jgi:hypothetical protein
MGPAPILNAILPTPPLPSPTKPNPAKSAPLALMLVKTKMLQRCPQCYDRQKEQGHCQVWGQGGLVSSSPCFSSAIRDGLNLVSRWREQLPNS